VFCFFCFSFLWFFFLKKSDGKLSIHWADPRNKVDEETMKKVKTLYVNNIHRAISDDILRAYFSQFGEITSCCIVKDSESRQSKGFGFVEFESRVACEHALKKLNQVSFCSQPLGVSLAKPQMEKKNRTKSGGTMVLLICFLKLIFSSAKDNNASCRF